MIVLAIVLSTIGISIGTLGCYIYQKRKQATRETRKYFHHITPFPYDPVSTAEEEYR